MTDNPLTNDFTPAFASAPKPDHNALFGDSRLDKPETSGISETVGAMFMNETFIGGGVDYARQAHAGDKDRFFNPYSYIGTMENPERKRVAMRLVGSGAFDPDRFVGGSSPETVEETINQFYRENERGRIVGNAGMWGLAFGTMASFADVSTVVPVLGWAKRAKAAWKAGTVLAGNAAAVSVGAETVLQAAQVDRSLSESFINIGAETVLGGGIGVFSQLLHNRALRKRVADAVDINAEVPVVEQSMGAAETPASQRFAYDPWGTNPTETGKYRHWWDSVPILSRSPIATTYRAASLGLQKSATIMEKLGAIGPREGHARGQVTGDTVEDHIAVQFQTRFATGYQRVQDAWKEYRHIGGKRSRKDFDLVMAHRLHSPDEPVDPSIADPVLERYAANAVDGPGGYREALNTYFDELNTEGMFPRDIVEETNAKVEKIEAELADLQAKQADPATVTTPKRGKRKKHADDILAKLQKRKERLEARRDRLTRQLQDRRNYFTQAWSKPMLLEKRQTAIDVLAEDFADLGRLSEEQVAHAARSATAAKAGDLGVAKLHAAINDDDAVLGAVEAYHDGGLDALPDDVASFLRSNTERYARQEAEQVVDGMILSGNVRLGMLDAGEIKSSRLVGRRLHLSTAARNRLMGEDILSNDVDQVVQSYTYDVGGKLAMKRVMGIRDANGVEALRSEIQSEINELVGAGKVNKAQADKIHVALLGGPGASARGALQVQMDRVLGRTEFVDTSGDVTPWVAAQMRKVVAMARLGGSTISAVTDLATAMYANGLKRSPGLMKLHGKFLVRLNAYVGKIPDAEMRHLMVGIENAIEGGRYRDLYGLTGEGASNRGAGTGAFRRAADRIERGLDFATDTFFSVNLMNRWTKALKTATGTIWEARILDLARGRRAIAGADREMLGRVGLTDGDLAWIADQPTWTHPDEGVELFATHEWAKTPEGARMRAKVFTAMKRINEEAVVTLRKGDTPPWMDNWLGKTLLQFQGFPMAWANRYARKALHHGMIPRDLDALGSMVMSLALGSGVYAVKEGGIKGRDLPSFGDEPDTWIYEAFDRGGFFGALMPIANGGLRVAQIMGATSTPTPSRFSVHNPLGAFAGPSVGMVGDLWDLTAAGVAGDHDAMAKKAYRLLPYNNLFYIDAAYRRLIED